LGRWITPDPKGFVDGLNLYAFVSNNPLTNFDLYGLEKNPLMPMYADNKSFHENIQNIDHSMMQGVMKFGSDIFMGMLRQFGYSEKFQMQTRTLEMIKNKPFSIHYAQFIDYTAHKLAAFDYSNTNLLQLSRNTTTTCHVGAIACGGRYVFEKALNRLGRAITPEINTFQSFERAFENKALSGLNLKQLIKNVKNFNQNATQNHNLEKIVKYIKTNGKALPGYEGGRLFKNRGNLLPKKGINGDIIVYREWDIKPKIPGKNRGAERLVSGSDGKVWYTKDHYKTFVRIK